MDAKDYAKRALKPPKDFFRFCETLFDQIIIFDKGEIFKTSADNKKRPSYEYKLRKNTNFSSFCNTRFAKIILVSKTRIQIQTYIIRRDISPTKPYGETVKIELYNLDALEEDKLNRIRRWGDRYSFGTHSMSGLGYYHYPVDYPQDYLALFKRSPLRYLELNSRQLTDQYIFQIYKYRAVLEVLSNLGAMKLYNQVASGSADMRKVTRNLIKKNKFLLKTYNFDVQELEIYEDLKGKIRLSPENCLRISSGLLTPNFVSSVEKYQIKNNISKNRLFKYLLKQNKEFYYYNDYIQIMNEIKMNDGEWTTLYPKDLTQAHNTAVSLLETVKRQLNEESMVQVYQDLKSINFKSEEYLIKLPEKLSDIVHEGITLKHCVGGKHYLDGHLEKKALILFVRKIDKPDDPLYTVEFSEGKILQCRGYRNRSSPQEVHEFLRTWLDRFKKDLKHIGNKERMSLINE